MLQKKLSEKERAAAGHKHRQDASGSHRSSSGASGASSKSECPQLMMESAFAMPSDKEASTSTGSLSMCTTQSWQPYLRRESASSSNRADEPVGLRTQMGCPVAKSCWK